MPATAAKKIVLKRVVPKTGDDAIKHLRQIQDHVEEAVNQAVLNASFGVVPIGGMVLVDLNLPGCPVPPANFMRLDGQVCTDKRSIFYGKTLRDMNVAGNFIRCGSTSGVVQAADTVVVVPAHAHSLNNHVHDLGGHTHAAGTLKVGSAGVGNTAGTLANTVSRTATTVLQSGEVAATGSTAAASGNTLGPSVANTATDGGSSSGAETRPKNISWVAFMRIW